MIANFNQAVTALQDHLEGYLQSKGINTSRKFRCINPDHDDKTPSCVLLPDRTRAFCHGCGSGRWDIFDAVRFLEGKVSSGPTFISEVLEPLAEQFGVALEKGKATPEQEYELSVRRAYQLAAEWIADQQPLGSSYVKERGWDWETLRTIGVGHVPSYTAFVQYMASAGFDSNFLTDADLDRTDIFGEGRLIFPTHDEHGRVVGFTARDLGWIEGCGRSKFINQQTTGLRCDIFQKGHRLYNIHRARKTKSSFLYLFEGQGDVITAIHHGIHNCAAVGGTSLTKDQVLLLRELGIHQVVICFDGDEAGQKATERVLDQRFSDHKEIRVKVITLPGGMDPDQFLRAEGKEGFQNLARPSAFEWRLQRHLDTPDADKEQVARSLIPLIVSEPSHISREGMCQTLARNTGYSLQAIQAEVQRLSDAEESRFQEQRSLIIDRTFRAIERDPNVAEALLSEAQSQLGALAANKSESKFSEDDCLRFITEQCLAEESRGPEHTGFVLGADLKPLQDALTGEWTKDVFCIFGGKSNHGKTSLLGKLAIEIARHQENDACVIYHSIDDTLEQLLPKFVCLADGSKTGLTINEVRYPGFWEERGAKGIAERRRAAYSILTDLTRAGRLVLKDANHGNGLGFAEGIIAHYRKKYPNRKMVFILDNFHKLPDYRKLQGDERLRFKAMSDQIKSIATRHHVAVLASAEYTKIPPGIKPSNYSIAETVQLDYDANLVAHVYNELGDIGAESKMFHMCNIRGTPQKLPIVEIHIGKNKITDFKESMFLRFYPASADFEPATVEDLRLAQEELENQGIEEALAQARLSSAVKYRPTSFVGA